MELDRKPKDKDMEEDVNGAITEQTFNTNGQIWRNTLVLCFAFMFLFTAFQSLSNLQSSLFIDEGMGTTTLSIIYGALVISCFFIPTALIDVLGCKWTVAFSMMMYIAFMLAHFYATWGLFVPAAILVGIGAAPLWSAKCTYLTDIAHDYGRKNNMSADSVVNLFFGVFFLIFQSGQIWGNLISSLVLTPEGENSTITLLPPEELAQCGKGFCPDTAVKTNNTNLDGPSEEKLFTLAGIYSGCACVAVLIIILMLQQLPSEDTKKGICSRRCSAGCSKPRLLIATFLHMKDYRQLLLIPITMFSGLEQGFLASDYTQAFITCPLGKWWVGYVLICFGVVDAICSFGFGRLVQYVGRMPFFILGALINYSLLITFVLYDVQQDYLAVYFVLAGLWGMSDAVWQTQINALYGVLFHENTEAGFANYRLWESIGFIIAFVYQSRLCLPYKAYFLIGVLTLGMIGYIIVEWKERQRKTRSVDIKS